MSEQSVTENAPHTATARIAALDERREQLLLERRDGGWALPTAAVSGRWYETGRVADALERSLGLDVFLQRCLWGDDNAAPAPDRLYAGQLMGRSVLSESVRWFPLDGLPELTSPSSAALPVVRRWADGGFDGQDWEHQDWLAEVARFVSEVLGHEPSEFSQLRTWPRSSVWRVSWPSSSLIFKASPPVFGHEGAVSSTLARLFPASFPRVVAQEPARHWLLMEDLTGPTLTDRTAPSWRAALAAFATIQIQAIEMRAELLHAGCPGLGIARLRSWTAEFLGPSGPVASGAVTGLTPDETATLVARAGEYDRAWQRLLDFGIAETLEHGDFRPGHIVIDTGVPRFFDLAEAALSHPFFSAVTLLDFGRPPVSSDPESLLWTDLRAGYLAPWAEVFPGADLEEAFEVARTLAPLQAALVRWFRLLPAMTPRDKWEFMISHWLRRLINR